MCYIISVTRRVTAHILMTGQDRVAIRMKIYVYDRKNVKKKKKSEVGENEKNRGANILRVHVAAPVRG